MKVLLTTLNSKFIHSCLALYYLRAVCRNDFDIKVREFTINENPAEVMAEIHREGPDVIGFSCYIWNIELTLKLAYNLKKINPRLLLVLGGPEVSFASTELMEQYPFIDVIVRGEGEAAFPELLSSLANGTVEPVRGTTWRQGETIIFSQDRELIKSLGDIPFPYGSELENPAGRMIYYETSRGCPFNCFYCISSTFRGVRWFPLDRVKRDLQFLVEQGTREIKFVDRTFNADLHRFREIIQFLVGLAGKTTFHFEIVADRLDAETLEFLQTLPSGLFKFEIGVQSTSENTLKAVNRKMNWPRLQHVVKTIGQRGNIWQHLDLIAGLPKEDYRSFAASFNAVYNLAPDQLQLGFLKMLKGSQLREEAERYDYRFTGEPPYEVLANRYISYDELLKLKRIEDLVDKYYNSRDFIHSLRFIIQTAYAGDAFAFYEQWAAYWEEQGWHRRHHRKEALYSLFINYVKHNLGGVAGTANELLKLDYLLNYKSNTLPEGLVRIEVPGQRQRFEEFLVQDDNRQRYFPELAGMGVGKIKRRVHLEVFAADVLFLGGRREKIVTPDSYYPVLFKYPPGGQKAVSWEQIEL